MPGDLEVHQFPDTGQQIRTIVDGEFWWVATDICAVLGHSNPTMAVASLDEDERGLRIAETPSGQQRMVVINEAGLYSLILRSRKPEAKAFKRWITHEVLPAIRKTGSYAIPRQMSRRDLAMMVIEEADRADRAEQALGIAQPKAEAYDVFMDADGTYSFEHVAKMLYAETGLGRNNLMKRLRELHVLERNNLPYQRYAEHFHVVAQTFTGTDGRAHTTYTTRVYPSGVDFIRRKVLAGKGMLTPALIG